MVVVVVVVEVHPHIHPHTVLPLLQSCSSSRSGRMLCSYVHKCVRVVRMSVCACNLVYLSTVKTLFVRFLVLFIPKWSICCIIYLQCRNYQIYIVWGSFLYTKLPPDVPNEVQCLRRGSNCHTTPIFAFISSGLPSAWLIYWGFTLISTSKVGIVFKLRILSW